MAETRTAVATDSASELHRLIGDDATATFEDDPTFVDSNRGTASSSDNVEEQREDAGKQRASGAVQHVSTAPGLRADGLLGQEDEISDAEKDRSRESGDAVRDRAESKIKDGSAGVDDDAGDVAPGVDEDKLNADDMDTDRVASTAESWMSVPAVESIAGLRI
jgi:hypothetical protein